uniref:Uncharacterized protein n=1 Tax=Arundo donax TaxID=35708 RepID=A0A0A8ZEQ5_ARUDO
MESKDMVVSYQLFVSIHDFIIFLCCLDLWTSHGSRVGPFWDRLRSFVLARKMCHFCCSKG